MSRTDGSPRHLRTRLKPMVNRLEERTLMAYAGVIDPTFGTGGVATLPNQFSQTFSAESSIAVEPDGSILQVQGETPGVYHITAAGALDTTYGSGGLANVSPPAGYDNVTVVDVLAQSDGKAVVFVRAGQTMGPPNTLTIVERFDTDGTPDSTFGTAGQVDLSSTGGAFGGVSFTLTDLLEPDGKVILAGDKPDSALPTVTDVVVARLDANGQVDTTYGTNGLATLPAVGVPPPGFSYTQSPSAVAIQPNGQLVVAATSASRNFDTTFPVVTPELFRLNADGTRDASLSSAGLQSTVLNTPSGLVVQPNGQILVIGSYTAPSPALFLPPLLARLNADGSFDGVITLSSSASLGVDQDIALQANGDILFTFASGSTNTTGPLGTAFVVTRLTPNLALDPTFGLGGVSTVYLPLPDQPSDFITIHFTYGRTIAVTPAGQILVGGVIIRSLNEDPALASDQVIVTRLNPTGTSAHPGDFNGDGIADPAIYLPAAGAYAIAYSSGAPSQLIPFGGPGLGTTIPAVGNYDATGKQEIGAYIPSLGLYAYRPPTGPDVYVKLGTPGPGLTIPAPGDYYGTGQDDVAVYLADLGAFAIVDPTGQTTGEVIPFGSAGVGASIPAPGDYFGTGHDDLAVYLPAAGAFAIADPAGKVLGEVVPFGGPGLGSALPMPGDYDGSGRTELAVYLPALGELVYRPAAGGNDVTIPFGGPGVGTVLPMAGDYSGSGRTEPGVYIPALGELVYRPPTGPDVQFPFGSPGLGQTIPVTRTVLFVSELGITGSNPGTVSALSFDFLPNIPNGLAPLEFLATSKKAKGGPVLA